jgi:uncharacterized protein (UPF0548 family)
MKLLWPGRRARLVDFAPRSFSPDSESPGRRDLPLRFAAVAGHEAPGAPGEGFRRVARAIRAYQIFPPELVSGVLARTPVEVGDTVGIAYRPFAGFGLFFAARVTEVFDAAADGTWRAGFTYRTVEGHPEIGQETFSVAKNLATGEVSVALESWSRAGLWLTWIGAPVARFAQKRASQAAVAHLVAQFGVRSS